MIRLVHSAATANATAQSSDSMLDDQALEWVVRLSSGQSTPEDHEAFRLWRDQSPEHLAALQRARTLWMQMGVAAPQIERRCERAAQRRRLWKVATPIAATILLAVHMGNQYWTVGRFDQVTAAGEHKTVTLPDGSVMTMSGDTALNVSYQQGVRNLDLSRGAIFVQVRHDETSPFVVMAGDARFQDIGTAFEVKRDGSGARLVVTEGVVEASHGGDRALVLANQATSIGQSLGPVFSTDAERDTAWVRGRLILKNQTLPQIVQALEPHYRGRIVLLDSDLEQQRLDADIDLAHVDAWLTALNEIKGVRVKRIAGVTFITSRSIGA